MLDLEPESRCIYKTQTFSVAKVRKVREKVRFHPGLSLKVHDYLISS